MFDFIWDIFQQGEINDLRTKNQLQDAKFDGVNVQADSADERLRNLEKRHEQLKLVTLALWRLLKDHTGLMESDLRKYVESTDLLDGRSDGKATQAKERVPCHSCDRIVLNTAVVCPYCGTRQKQKSVFGGA